MTEFSCKYLKNCFCQEIENSDCCPFFDFWHLSYMSLLNFSDDISYSQVSKSKIRQTFNVNISKTVFLLHFRKNRYLKVNHPVYTPTTTTTAHLALLCWYYRLGVTAAKCLRHSNRPHWSAKRAFAPRLRLVVIEGEGGRNRRPMAIRRTPDH